MIIKCAHCEQEGKPSGLGEKAPYEDRRTTHGICDEHMAATRREITRVKLQQWYGNPVWEEVVLDAICILDRYRQLPPEDQGEHRAVVVDAFRDFWLAHPPVDIFATHMSGLVLMPEILWIMSTKTEGRHYRWHS